MLAFGKWVGLSLNSRCQSKADAAVRGYVPSLWFECHAAALPVTTSSVHIHSLLGLKWQRNRVKVHAILKQKIALLFAFHPFCLLTRFVVALQNNLLHQNITRHHKQNHDVFYYVWMQFKYNKQAQALWNNLILCTVKYTLHHISQKTPIHFELIVSSPKVIIIMILQPNQSKLTSLYRHHKDNKDFPLRSIFLYSCFPVKNHVVARKKKSTSYDKLISDASRVLLTPEMSALMLTSSHPR